jgi:hypothetical protein
MICNLNNVNEIIKSEGLDILVISYGGCCSNKLIEVLKQNNYICNTNIYEKILCHCPKYIDIDIPVIYIYDNPIKSFISMKNRGSGIWDLNQQKMSNDMNTELSDENLLKCMINQFNIWTNVKRDNVLIIKSSEIFEDCIVDKLEFFLKNKIYNFPIKYENPKTDIKDIKNIENKEILELFEKYKLEIDRINNFVI